MQDRTLSHYRVQDLLGAGGMGSVYRAVDLDLNRPVAIKFLKPEFAADPDRRDRFMREARAAAALSHASICTIHEIGRLGNELFLVMQLIDGRPLSAVLAAGPLPWDRVDAIARQLADALAAAHAAGIVHRDLKPSNIMLRGRDQVTVLDFGIASMFAAPAGAGTATTVTDRIWRPHDRGAGTIGYMSPEQIRGGVVDAASDIFSLGATLYEAATGNAPFARASGIQTVAATLDEEPLAIRGLVPDFPPALAGVIERCLSKQVPDRYADGRVLVEALRHDTTPETPVRPRATYRSIVVLPVVAAGDRPEDVEVCEAVAREITTTLARLKGVLVMARGAAEPHLRSQTAPRDVARALGVQTVLEVALSRRDTRSRIAVQLLDASTQYCLWGASYEFPDDDLFHIQDMVANRVGRALKTRLAREHGLPPGEPAVGADAYRLYLKGRTLYYRFNSTDNLLAIDAFRRALRLEPAYARAHAGLASACLARVERAWDPDPSLWMTAAVDASKQSLEHDAWSAEAYAARGSVFLRQGRPYDAEAEFKRALNISPNDEIAHSMLGVLLFERGDLVAAARSYRRALRIRPDYVWCWNDLAWNCWLMGRFADTERALARVLEINPVDEVARVGIATGYYFRGELAEAEAIVRESIAINPHHPFARPMLAFTLAFQGHVAEAVDVCDAVLREHPDDFLATAALGVVHAIARDRKRLDEVAARALAIPAPRVPLNANLAVHFAFLGHEDQAVRWIRKAMREGMRADALLTLNPFLRPLATELQPAR